MICEAHTCAGCQYLESQQDEQAYSAEFLTDCQHVKCKVVRLVRQQISKLQNRQDEETQSETSNKIHEAHDGVDEWHSEEHDIQDKEQQIQQPQETQIIVASQVARMENTTKDLAIPWYHSMPLARIMRRKWMMQILNRIGYRAHLIIAAATLGIIVWIALVYGIFLGATACGNSRIYFASSLKYTNAKRSLF